MLFISNFQIPCQQISIFAKARITKLTKKIQSTKFFQKKYFQYFFYRK